MTNQETQWWEDEFEELFTGVDEDGLYKARTDIELKAFITKVALKEREEGVREGVVMVNRALPPEIEVMYKNGSILTSIPFLNPNKDE